MMALLVASRGPMRGPVRRSSIPAFILAFALAPLAGAAAQAFEIDVALDQARLVKLPEKVATLVIGNPLIADATIQNGGLMVITGKGYGSTNLIALDRSGAVLMENTVRVSGPNAETVVVYRGMTRETYSCTPTCEPRITLGDAPNFFDSALGQATVRSGLAQGIAPSKDK